MDREELLGQIRSEIQQRFMDLSDREKEIIRENRDSEYAQLLRDVLGSDLLGNLRAGRPQKSERRGLMVI